MNHKLTIFVVAAFAFFLRFSFISNFPIGLNADEAAIGYNAYSLLKTGKDEHGQSWPLVFRSFDDYKPPLYFYLTIPFVATLGLNEMSVRLPSVILGSLTIVLIYFICEELFKNRRLALISSFILATSPWHLQFSRGGWEVNVSTFFISLSVLLFIKSLRRPSLVFPSMLSAFASLYTYHSARVVTPFLIFTLIILFKNIFFSQLAKYKLIYLITTIAAIILSIPLARQMLTTSGQARFNGVSIFADSGPLSYVLEMRRTSSNPSSVVTKLQYNRYFAYSGVFLKNYLSHFDPRFLFISGDVIKRNSIPYFGQSLHVLIIPFALGLFYLMFKLKGPQRLVVFFWFLTAPIAASLTYQSPHALRSENMVVPLSIITAIGLDYLLKMMASKKVTYMFVLLPILSNFTFYLYAYYALYPRMYPEAWQYGFREVIDYIKPLDNKYQNIIFSTRSDQPYILAAFYLKYPPELLQKELVMTPIDRYGFSTGSSFGKFTFRPLIVSQDLIQPHTLVVTVDEKVPSDIEPIKEIGYQNYQKQFHIFSKE